MANQDRRTFKLEAMLSLLAFTIFTAHTVQVMAQARSIDVDRAFADATRLHEAGDIEGAIRGYALAPLYPTVPQAAAKDVRLYESLALLDAIRDGRARERNLATKELESRLQTVRA